ENAKGWEVSPASPITLHGHRRPGWSTTVTGRKFMSARFLIRTSALSLRSRVGVHGADGAVLEPGGITEASGYRSWLLLARQPAEVVGGSRRDRDAIEGVPGP